MLLSSPVVAALERRELAGRLAVDLLAADLDLLAADLDLLAADFDFAADFLAVDFAAVLLRAVVFFAALFLAVVFLAAICSSSWSPLRVLPVGCDYLIPDCSCKGRSASCGQARAKVAPTGAWSERRRA